jgi:hypothetical protein
LPAVAAQRSGVEASLQSGSLSARSVRQTISAGNGADGSPRAALKAASCNAKDRLALKNRNELASASILNGLDCQTALHVIFDPQRLLGELSNRNRRAPS